MNKGAIRLFNKLKEKSYVPKNICEVGVYLPEESNVLGFIKQNIPTTLVEADPNYANKIREYFSEFKNVKVIEAAIADFHGEVELCKRESSTFISFLEESPALINDKCKKEETEKFWVKAILFSEIDKGDFDLVCIDIEGAEWFVIRNMVSRPRVICVETHGKFYTNPYLSEIKDWMLTNNYQEWYKYDSDTIFVCKGTFSVTIVEKLQLLMKSWEIRLIKMKQPIKKLLLKFRKQQ